MSSAQGDSAGSSSNSEYKRSNQSRRGASNRAHHGRSPQTAAGKDDLCTTAQKRIRNLQQKSHEKPADYKLRPQTGRSEHSRGADSSKPPQRSNSSQAKAKGNVSHHRKGQSHDSDCPDPKSKKVPKENGAPSKTTSKDIKRSERKDSGIGHSPPSVEPNNELESTDTSIVDLLIGGAGESESEDQERVTATEDAPVDSAEEKKSNRIQYTRDELLSLSKSPTSLQKHPSLDESIDIIFLKQCSMPNQNIESEGDVKRKHPTALSLIREHDARQLPKVSLSPQRKSFHGGCSWNDSKASDTPSSAKDSSRYFEFENTYPPSSKANQGSSQQGPPLQSKHKVIDHVPLRDQELGRGNKKNWRERSKESEWAKNNHYQNTWEEEPEWMEFGPNDRFELMELTGLEEHEREREARLGREESGPQPREEDTESPLLIEEPEEQVGKEQCELEPITKEPKAKGVRDVPSKKEVMLKAALDMDNFMLDGFDFSTGLSFCTALDDEEEMRSTQSPAEVGNALMKVLKIGGDERQSPGKDKAETILGVSSRPVNALTLDEIHARENIQTTPTLPTPNKPSNADLGAFNKLVAGLQFSGALHKESSEAGQHQVKQSPSTPVTSSINTVSMPSPSIPSSSSKASAPFRPENVQPPQDTFGNILEKEMDFDEEVITGSHPHYQRPPPEIPPQYPSRVSRVEHLERMLEKLDQEQILRDRHKPLSSELPPTHMASGYTDPHMKAKLLPGLSTRMSGGPPMEGQRMSGGPLMEGQRMSGAPRPPMEGQRMSGGPLTEGQRSMHMMDREYMYHEGEHRMDMLPPPSIGIRPQGGMNRPSANHWAIEMERRRLMELKQMERAQMERAMYSNSMHRGVQHKMRETPPPKPNISLLPTAVMRQMHNNKPNQTLSDVAKSSSFKIVDPRVEQEFNMKGSMSHSPISNAYNEVEHPSPRHHPSQMYAMGGGQMRNGPPAPFRPVSDPAAPMMYRGYYNMPVIPHGGMQNPYMY